jgi:hypothetical protein
MSVDEEALRNSEVHAALAALSSSRTFYTTNYDDYLEKGLKLHGRTPVRIATEVHVPSLLVPHDAEVIKFHGDWDFPETMVLTEQDYHRRLELSTLMDSRMRADMMGRAVLFLGYSFRDWNVAYLFHVINREFQNLPQIGSGRRAYIAVGGPSDFEIELFHRRNIDVIELDRGNETADLAHLLGEIAS